MSYQKGRRAMASKKKEKNLKRSNIITLKLTDIELAVLNETADVTGLSHSEYLRKLLLEKQINHQIEVVADMNDLRKLVNMERSDRISIRSPDILTVVVVSHVL